MTCELSAGKFGAFYEGVHGYPPFKWQSELAGKVIESGWPRDLDMPTAAGKTSVIDVAVFHLAMEVGKRKRGAPVRIVFVVDRRLVVDGAFEHAVKIAKALEEPKNDTVKAVAERLKTMSGDKPLAVARLRGAVPQDKEWAKTPSQPLVIVSTIDQVGSRLLFRGYGVTDSMKPVHAGLLGSDALYILDEAHTSTSFMDTLEQINRIKSGWDEDLPFGFMFMSATLGRESKDAFPKDAEAKKSMIDGRLKARMDAHKYASLVEVKQDDGLEGALVKCALDVSRLCSKSGKTPKSIGVVVNRVNLARSVFKALRSELKETGASVHLLTGRSRPLERDAILGAEIDKIKPGEKDDACKKRDPDSVDFFVATQSIEVGVDIDLDALVTQVAPIDSLRQRFGRLDRVGRIGTTHSVVLASKKSVGKSQQDPIYGDRLQAAWEYLRGAPQVDGCPQCSDLAASLKRLKGSSLIRTVDFGVNHFPSKGWEEATAKATRRVTLMPAYVRMWSQTSPRPDPDPEPGLFLHGPDSSSADVHVVWRADITKEMTAKGYEWRTRLDACRPSQLEAVTVPVWIVRRWMKGAERSGDLGDVEGAKGAEQADDRSAHEGWKAVRWRGAKSQDTGTVSADDIRPGDTLVVPSSVGGCDMYGWDESDRSEVSDIGMEAGIVNRRSLDIRLGKEYVMHAYKHAFGQSGPDAEEQDADRIKQAVDEVGELRTHAHKEGSAALDELRAVDGLPNRWKKALGALPDDGSLKVYKTTHDNDGRKEISGLKVKLNPAQAVDVLKALSPECAKMPIVEIQDTGARAYTDDSAGGHTGSEQKLLDHSRGVEGFVKEFAGKIKMDDGVAAALALAGLLHDAGKAERRVQAMMRRLDPDDIDVDNADLLAKSKNDAKNYAEYKENVDRAGLPERYRHECWSVVLAASHARVKGSEHEDLIKYLIGTHHGHGRPMFPAVTDHNAGGKVEWAVDGEGMSANAKHGLERLDSGWADMCDGLYRKYGPWRLAHMESIIRLADHCQSAKEDGDG